MLATIPADKELYQRQIEATDRQIDGLVYELYELTEEEIGVVEGGESLNALRGVSTLKGASVISGFQWGQWFSGRAD